MQQRRGYVKLYRKLLDWEWFHDGNMLKALTWLIMNANTQDSEYRGVPVRRGSLVISMKELSESLSGRKKHERISLQQLRTILKRLQRTGEIIVSSTNEFSVITVCKYDVYQGSNTLFDGESINEQQTSNRPSTNEQQHNKNIRIQEDNILLTHTREDLLISEEMYAGIKQRYNSEFENVFRPCQRLTLNARIAIRQCLETFGRGSLDTVFRQLRQSPFLTGAAPSGWTPDILWLFTPANYERILSGYYTARKKSPSRPAGSGTAATPSSSDFTPPTPEQVQQAEQRKFEETRQRWLRNISLAERDPSSSVCQVVIKAYKAGTLRQYGISWQPPQSSSPSRPVGRDTAAVPHPSDVTQQDIAYINSIVNRKQ